MSLWGALVAGVACSSPAGGELPERWRRAAADPGVRGELLAALEAQRSAGAYGDLAPVAGALLAQAERAARPAEAAALASLAAAAAPTDPRPRAFLARFHLSRSVHPVAAVVEGWNFLTLAAADPWVQGVGLLCLGAAAALAAWAAALALLIAGGAGRGALVFHDYRDSFPRRFRTRTPLLLAGLVTVTLWSAGTGPAFFLLLCGLALAPYFPRPARCALGVCLGAGCLLGWGLGSLSSVAGPSGERAWALYRVWRGDGGDPLLADLQRLFPADDPRALFARSRVARRGEDPEGAAALLERAMALPGAPRAMLHQELGTLRFLQGNTEEALREFAQAAAADPADPLPWLNRHVVHLDRLELGLADQAHERARALGAQLVDRSQRRFTEGARHPVPVAPPMPAEWVRSELLGGGSAAATPWVTTLSQGLFVPIRGFDPALLGLLALGVLIPVGQSGAGRRSHRCPSCGFVVCPRCGRRVKETPLCPACWAAGREEAADTTEKGRQSGHVATWQVRRERWHRVGRVLLPGWSDFVATGGVGHLALGILWAGSVGWFALAALYPLSLFPWSAPGAPWASGAGVGLAHAAGLWLAPRGPRAAKG